VSAHHTWIADLGDYYHWALVTLYKLLVAAAIGGGAVHEGHAPYYAANVMERVSERRGLPQVGCMVSSPRYPLGTWLWVWGRNTGVLLHCRVTDVSADTNTTGRGRSESDRQRHIRLGWELELGHTEAIRLCSLTAMREPPTGCPIVVIRLEQ
jgi:hypothetical protein